MLRILRRIGESFIPDHKVEAGGRKFFLDFYIPSAAIGIECHSMKWHGPSRHNNDARRGRFLASLGIELLYFTFDDLTVRPHEVESELKSAIKRRQLRL